MFISEFIKEMTSEEAMMSFSLGTISNHDKGALMKDKKKTVKEDASSLNIGDDVIITGDVEFHGSTGVITQFGRDKNFVVVDLYNHGKRSFHSSDVSYNDYAGSDEEEEDWEEQQERERSRMGEAADNKETFKVIYYDPRKDKNITRMIRAENESDIWDAMANRGVDVVSVEKKSVKENIEIPGIGTYEKLETVNKRMVDILERLTEMVRDGDYRSVEHYLYRNNVLKTYLEAAANYQENEIKKSRGR